MADLQKNLQLLADACACPRARMESYLAQGKKVVGCFAPYAPEELVHACGMIPFGMWGGNVELIKAKSYLPAFACPIMQANMELALNGAYRGLSAVIISAMCDTLRCMTQNWRFGVKDIPLIPIVYPQNRTNPASTEYLISEFESVLVMLNTITGQMMSEASLKRTIEVYNEHNAVMRRFLKLANDHLDVITPTVRHHVVKSGYFYEKSEHTAIVKEIIEELEKRPAYAFPGKKAVLAGIQAEPDGLLKVFEECGVAVVGDDLCQESRQLRTDVPEESCGGLRRLAHQWMARYGCSMIHEMGKPRGKMLAKMCEENGADGVVNLMMKFCDPEEYDQPWLEKDVRAAGYPVVSIEIDPLNTSYEQLRTRIEAFNEL